MKFSAIEKALALVKGRIFKLYIFALTYAPDCAKIKKRCSCLDISEIADVKPKDYFRYRYILK